MVQVVIFYWVCEKAEKILTLARTPCLKGCPVRSPKRYSFLGHFLLLPSHYPASLWGATGRGWCPKKGLGREALQRFLLSQLLQSLLFPQWILGVLLSLLPVLGRSLLEKRTVSLPRGVRCCLSPQTGAPSGPCSASLPEAAGTCHCSWKRRTHALPDFILFLLAWGCSTSHSGFP